MSFNEPAKQVENKAWSVGPRKETSAWSCRPRRLVQRLRPKNLNRELDLLAIE